MNSAGRQGYGEGISFVLLATLGWSLSGLFVRLMPGLDGWQLNCWRGFWMAVALLCYLVVVYGRDLWSRFRAIPVLALCFSAGFFALGSTLYVTSLTLVSTATISVIGASSPIFTGFSVLGSPAKGRVRRHGWPRPSPWSVSGSLHGRRSRVATRWASSFPCWCP
jgi:drug/metabolite transporter (DMT)-like permease